MTRPAPSGGCDLQLVLFARASSGSPGGGSRLRRWCGRGAGEGAPSPALRSRWAPPARPLAAPSSRSSPPRRRRRRHPRRGGWAAALWPGARARRAEGRARGSRPSSARLCAAGTGALAAGGRGAGPGCGLWRVQARRRRDAAAATAGSVGLALGPAVPPATARPGAFAAGAPPARPPGSGRAMAPRLRLTESAASPPPGGRETGREVRPRPRAHRPSPRFRGRAGRLAGDGGGASVAGGLRPGPPRLGEPLAGGARHCLGVGTQFLLPGCGRAARAGKLT